MECKHVQRIKLFAVAASSARKQTVRRKPAPAPMPRLQAEELQAPCPAGTARRGCVQGCPCGDCKMRFSENPECGPARRPPKRSRMRRARLRGPRQQEDRGPHARPGKGGRGRRGPAARRHGGRARAFLPRMAACASRRAPPASLVWSTDGLRTRLRKAEHCRNGTGYDPASCRPAARAARRRPAAGGAASAARGQAAGGEGVPGIAEGRRGGPRQGDQNGQQVSLEESREKGTPFGSASEATRPACATGASAGRPERALPAGHDRRKREQAGGGIRNVLQFYPKVHGTR